MRDKKQNPEVCINTGTTGDYFAKVDITFYICKQSEKSFS